jgi:hypothetical protein
VNVELLQGLLLAFALVVVTMPFYIRLLRYLGFGKRIRLDGPHGHLVKEGTPTMGGLLLIAVVVVLFLLLKGIPERGIVAPIGSLTLVGALGAVDDYLNARTGVGICQAKRRASWSGSPSLPSSSPGRSTTPTPCRGFGSPSLAMWWWILWPTSPLPPSPSSPPPTG